jgi:hypothetical protein
MSERHGNLVIRFYPKHGEWTCVVQRVDADGMPVGGDLVSATGPSKEESRLRALASTTDPAVREALERTSGR